MPQDQYVTLSNSIKKQFQTPDGGTGYATASFNADSFLSGFDQSVILNRYSPVLQKKIGSEYQNNIAITGTFRTNCDMSVAGINGGFSFINVRKNSTGKASAYSGYGFAWRPSLPVYTEEIAITNVTSIGGGYYDIAIANDPDADNNLMFLVYGTKKTYVPFNYVSYAGGKMTDCYLPTVAPTAELKVCHMSPNLYICDNDPVHGDMYAAKYMIDPLTGLSYIQSGTAVILPDTNYWFKVVISDSNAISVYLRDDDSPFEESDKVISSGATTTIAEYLGAEDMDSFGISVYDTCGYQWWYDNLKISKLGGEYAVAYFRFDVSDMPEDLQIELNAYGTAETNGIEVSVWNHITDGVWDTILTASVSDYAVLVTNIISKAYYAVGGVIDIMVTTISPSTISLASTLYIDYIKVVRAMVSGVHMGGCVDVYVDDPDAVIEELVDTVDAVSSSMVANGVYNISSISIGGVDILYAKDYIISEADPSYANSILSRPTIKFSPGYAGETATVSYWASDAIASAQALFDDDAHRPLGLNVLVRHKAIHEITISPTDNATKTLVTDYVDSLPYDNGTKTISYSDLSKYIYGETGAYQPVILTIKSYDGNRMKYRTISAMGQEYPIDEIETFRIM